MRQAIDQLFASRSQIPLYYIESGSRLWGIASPDSDYDVRGFHLQSKSDYYDFKKHRDLIEVMDGDFDFVSYDIDKMFGLLAKSNPTVFEWIRADIVYLNHLPDWQNLQKDIIDNFDFKALFHHYISLAKGQLKLMVTDRLFTYKKTFYCIRGLLSAQLAAQQIVPALLIGDLFAQFDKEFDILTIAKESLDRKKQQKEKQEVEEDRKPQILKAVNEFIDYLGTHEPESNNSRAKLEQVLTDYSFSLKSLYYGTTPDNTMNKGDNEVRTRPNLMSMSKEERAKYYKHIERLSDEASYTDTLRIEAEERVREDERRKHVIRMIQMNLSNEQIAEALMLSIDDIIAIRKENNLPY